MNDFQATIKAFQTHDGSVPIKSQYQSMNLDVVSQNPRLLGVQLSRLSLWLSSVALILYVWPTWAPFHQNVYLTFKVNLWTFWYAIPLVVFVSVIVPSWLLNGVSNVGARSSMYATCLLVFICVYTASFVPNVQGMNDEWLLSMCIQDCVHPWDDCRLHVRQKTGSQSQSTESFEFFAQIYGLPDETAVQAIRAYVQNDQLVIYSDKSTNKIMISMTPQAPQRILIGGSLEGYTAHVSIPDDWVSRRHYISTAASVMNRVAQLIRSIIQDASLSVYGCSIGGKIAYYAALTSDVEYENAIIDSGGAMVSTMQIVGPCGETLEAMQRRWPGWLAESTPPVAAWPFDVGDLMSNCRQTAFLFTTAEHDLWNNPLGLKETVRVAESFGCNVRLFTGLRTHCML